MAFQIKNHTSISASMINWCKATQSKVTDFNVGSVIRTMLEAIAAEIDELYQQMFIGLKEAIPVAVYNSFNFSAITQRPASGLIRVTVTSASSPNTIPAATLFSVIGTGATYLSNADVTIAPGATYVDVLVTAAAAGSGGNILAGLSFAVAPAISGFVSASNTAGFINGVDTETDAARKSRFNAFIGSLPRGTNAALLYGLTNYVFILDVNGNPTERVASAAIIEPWLLDNTQPVSLVNCYIYNGTGGTSAALIAQARKIMYGYYDANGIAVAGWKAAGVHVEVYAATETSVAVTAALTMAPGYDKPTAIAAANQAISAYIANLAIGASIIKSELIAIVMNIDGVFNVALSAPAADVSANAQTKLVPGTITLS